ncbi:MAG: mechanosensitive ion channel family protein [Candidatus Zapsychrus exili]|nr:mechanosensitive ion channel family protein [Candidatus Zapsychrus exili]
MKTLKIQVLSLMALFSSKLAFAQEQPQNITDMATQQLDTVKNLVQVITEFGVKYSFQVIGGLIVLALGWVVAGYIGKIIIGMLEKKNVDVTVSKFLVGTVKFIIIAFAGIVALGKFGIEIAPLIAGVSVAGFGLSFALQGPLSNYASGATLIFTKPFKVGEIIEVAGVMGEVTDMKLPRTEIRTMDGDLVFIPNKHIVGEVIHNYSTDKRLDLNVGVSYSADIGRAIKIVEDSIKIDKRVTKGPKVGITEFADSSVNIYARVWCRQDDYLDVMFDANKNIFDSLKKNNIEIPFPQRDVRIVKE